MSIDKYEDIIDSREVIERITELVDAGADTTHEETQELAALEVLAEQGETFEDWSYGVTLVRDSYFERYAEELADDLGIDPPDQWPLNCIDWAKAARDLQMDYTAVDFDGVTYWGR